MSSLDLTCVDELVARLGRRRRDLIPLLQGIQAHYRYLPPEALERLCRLTEITPEEVESVAGFYDQFRHRPVGRHMISVCHGTACHIKGSVPVHEALAKHLGIAEGQDTDPRGLFTIQKVACLGCCTLAPVVQIDHVTYGHLTPETVARAIKDFLALSKRKGPPPAAPRPSPYGGEIRIGLGSCCQARGSARVQEALAQALAHTGSPAAIKPVGCVGRCHQTPLVEVVAPDGATALYARVEPEDARAIVLRHFQPPSPWRRLTEGISQRLERLLTDESQDPLVRYGIDVRDAPVSAFLGPQRHIATEHCGNLDPTDLDEYRRAGGFEALAYALAARPEELIELVTASGLRGRGGAGFPTGRKWQAVRQAVGEPKYVVCNVDEGDPGAFMDRMLLESYPHRVIEGLLIAARSVGAAEAYFYIRAEYPLAVQRVRLALEKLRGGGLVGTNILGTGFDLEVRIMEGAGAFVCGEETALLASIEGRRGMPRLRPPFPASRGLWGQPTLVNNVETLAMVPWIVRHGPAALAALGSGQSKGTKVFALAGKVARGGLIAVPMGVSIRQIVEQIGGGVAGGACCVAGVASVPPPPGATAAEFAAVPPLPQAEHNGHGCTNRSRGTQSAAETPVLREMPVPPRRFKAVQIGGPSGGCIPAEMADLTVDYQALTSAGAIMGSGGLVVLDDEDCMVDIARYFLEFTQGQSCGKCTACRVGTRRMLEILTRLCEGHGRRGDLEELEQLAHVVQRQSLCGLGKTAPNHILTTLRYFRPEYEAHLAKRCPAGRCKGLVRYVVTERCIGCTKCAQHCPAGAIAMQPHQRHRIDPSKCTRCGTCRRVCPERAIRVE